MKKLLPVLLLPAGAAAAFVAETYRYVCIRGGSKLLNPLLDKKTHDEGYYAHRDGEAARLRTLPQKRYVIRSSRGERLVGHYIPGGGKGKRIAFLVHGYHSEYADTAGMYYDYYASRGFDLFACDHTAHGESEGKAIGFGVFESEDCLLWLDFLRHKYGEDIQILLHGFSMGAQTVLLMSDRCPDNVRLIVEDSGYRDAPTQLKKQLGALYAPVAALHRRLAHCDVRLADARPALAKARQPILFVHGQNDPTVPSSNGPALFALYRGEKDCLFPEKARHVESFHVEPEAYQRKLDRMIARTFRP